MTVPLKFFRLLHLDLILTAEKVWLLEFYLLRQKSNSIPDISFMSELISLTDVFRTEKELLVGDADDSSFGLDYTYTKADRRKIIDLFPDDVPRSLKINRLTHRDSVDAVTDWVSSATDKIIFKTPGPNANIEILDKATDFTEEKIRAMMTPFILQDFIQSKLTRNLGEASDDRLACVRQTICVYYDGSGLIIKYLPPLVRVATKKFSEGIDEESAIVGMKRGAMMIALAPEADVVTIKSTAKTFLLKIFRELTENQSLDVTEETSFKPDTWVISQQDAESYNAERPSFFQPATVELQLNSFCPVSKYKNIAPEPE